MQCFGAVPGGGVQRDQRPVCRLVQLVQCQSPGRVRDRLARPAGGAQLGDKPIERGLELGPHLPGCRALPVVPGGTVAQSKARQQLAAMQRDRLLQRGDRRPAASGAGH